MSPRWVKVAGFLAATALSTPASAKVDAMAAALITPAPAPAKSCSGAFRYAARVGNTDIVEISPVQAFARDRRLSRIRYSRGGSSDAGTTHLMITMCGAR